MSLSRLQKGEGIRCHPDCIQKYYQSTLQNQRTGLSDQIRLHAGELRNFENVQITAHMGSYARETRDLMEREASQLLVNALQEIKLL